MFSNSDHQTSFIVSNYNPPLHGFFQGYCFVGADFVFGAEGAQRFYEATGEMIPGALDGCYVISRRKGDAYIFDIDFGGYKVLYYYHDGETWVVSNSFAQVVDFLRYRNLPVTPNYAHLAAIAGRGMASGQLFSLETTVVGIRVAPRTHSLIVTPNQILHERRTHSKIGEGSYQTKLAEYLDTWVRRFETLMLSDKADFSADLTGGVDSRANFALVQGARRRLGNAGTQPRLNCGSTPTHRSDLDIAEILTDHFGLALNDTRKFKDYKLSAHEGYMTFRDLSLGVYYPLYMPVNGPTPTRISISGGGGGIHRKIYENHLKSKDVNKFFQRYASYFDRPEYIAEFIRDGEDFLSYSAEERADPLRTLLRDGRVRYHTGRSPRYGVTFTPLHSVSADQAQLVAGYDRIEEGQFNYDVMYSLQPELVDIPFDKPEKSPTSSIRNRLSKVNIPSDARPGRVWVGHLNLERNVDASKASRLREYKQAFDKAIEDQFVVDFWGQGMLDSARVAMNTLNAGKSIGNAVNGKPISAVLTAYLVRPS